MNDEDEDDPHSGPGIASFVVALLAGILMIMMVVAAGVMESQPGGIDQESPLFVAVVLAFLVGAAMTLMGLALGIAGLFQARRIRTFAIVGTLISVMEMLAVIGLVVLGMLTGE